MKSAALIAFSTVFLFATASDAPEALIQSLFAHDQPGKDKSLDWCDRETISKYADARLTSLFIKDCECSRRTKEICNLDSDPFYNAQDFDTADPNPRIKRLTATAYEVTITNFGEQKLIYKMKKTSDGWRISDIEWPADKSSLVKLLSTKPQ